MNFSDGYPKKWEKLNGQRDLGLFHLSKFKIVQIIAHSHFEPVSLLLALEATELVTEPVTEMPLESINNHLIFITTKEISVKATFFFDVTVTINSF